MGAPTTTIRRPSPVSQESPGDTTGGEGLPPGPSGDVTLYATGALTLLTVVVALGLGRLFADGSFIAPVVMTAVGCHAVAWACRRWSLSPMVAVAAGMAIPALVVAWLVLPKTTFYGIPTGATVSHARHELSLAYGA